MSKKKFQTAPEKKQQPKYEVKTSYDCEACNHQCTNGLHYLKNIMPGKISKGIVCKHE